MALTNKLTAIGNAIRAKNGETALYTLDEMPQKIAAIETGSGSGSGVIGQLVPEDYQQVLYLQCDGSQYLISDYYPNGHTQIISQFYNNNSAQSPLRYMYGVRNEGDTASFSGSVIWYSKNNWRYGTQALIVQNTSSHNTGWYSIQGYTKQSNFAKSGLVVADIGVGDTLGRGSYTVEEFQSELPMYILSCNINGSASAGAQGNLYRMTIKENDVIVRDFIPCYRKSDSKPGLYDIVNKQFYTNAGSGEFSFPEYTIQEVNNETANF